MAVQDKKPAVSVPGGLCARKATAQEVIISGAFWLHSPVVNTGKEQEVGPLHVSGRSVRSLLSSLFFEGDCK
jgi:hypothetical protein